MEQKTITIEEQIASFENIIKQEENEIVILKKYIKNKQNKIIYIQGALSILYQLKNQNINNAEQELGNARAVK